MSKNAGNTEQDLQTLVEEISVFIDYSVAENERSEAASFLQTYKDNRLVLTILRDFYAELPELREEAVTDVRKIVSRLECYLFQVSTQSFEYLYFFNGEKAFLLGEKKEGINDSEVLGFFGYENNEALQKALGAVINEGADGLAPSENVFCPSCAVKVGELHEFGCPVEICPWCDGQLTYCNCRFEKLDIDEVVSEEELERLEILLNDAGRIPFSAGQAPSYPQAGSDGE